MDFPALAFLVLALWAAGSKGSLYVYLPWIMFPFGAMAAISPSLTMGSTVLPTSVAMSLFVVKVALDPQSRKVLMEAATQARAIGLFAAYTGYTVLGGLLLPRLLEGKILVIGIRQADDQLYALAPSTANFTQTAYTVLSFLFCIALVGHLRGAETEARLQRLLRGLYLSGGILALTGVADFLGGKDLLDLFRTGSYAIYGYTEVNGSGRITGTFAEASSFGTAAVFEGSFLLMALPALPAGLLRQVAAPLIITTLLAMAALSTSSTAYAGLLILTLCLAALGLKKMVLGNLSAVVPVLLVLCVGLTALSAVFIWSPQTVETANSLASVSLTEKSSSLSYKERQYWNQTAMAVFKSSDGLGAGPGTERASSWPMVILSNLGVPGALSMGLFMVLSFTRRPSLRTPAQRPLLGAGKVSLFIVISMSTLSGAVLDPGISVCFLSALILACSSWEAGVFHVTRRALLRKPSERQSSVLS